MSPSLRTFRTHTPQLGARVFVDNSAVIIGQVTLGDDVSIWPTVVVRADVNYITIGARSNIQDASVIHVSHDGPPHHGGRPTVIGEDVTIGHGVMLHGCTIHNACLIGMRAIVLDGVIVGQHSMIGANSLVTANKVIGEGELWMGSPARYIRKLSSKEIDHLYYSSTHYVKLKDDYL